jgi:membrane-bound metal-dependent hydrolase YbcI (DUF457 family)
MKWKSHAIIGAILAFLTLYLILGTRDAIQLVFLSIFGALCALAPDLDHESSKGRRIADKIAVALAIWIPYSSACGGRICLPISNAVPMVFMGLAILGIYFVLFTILKPRHRGITHTLVANLVFAILVYLVGGPQLALIGAIGYFSHLLADNHIVIV